MLLYPQLNLSCTATGQRSSNDSVRIRAGIFETLYSVMSVCKPHSGSHVHIGAPHTLRFIASVYSESQRWPPGGTKQKLLAY